MVQLSKPYIPELITNNIPLVVFHSLVTHYIQHYKRFEILLTP